MVLLTSETSSALEKFESAMVGTLSWTGANRLCYDEMRKLRGSYCSP